jgi:CBS domain-containing protein
MYVRDLMTRNAQSCTLGQTAGDAARRMWDFDIGCVPVLDENQMPIAMVTDRDVCMAAYTQCKSPHQIPIAFVMSKGIHTCKESDPLALAERTMRDWQIRRLPVVSEDGKLVGMLSLNDIALAGTHSTLERAKQRLTGDVHETLAAVCRHRSSPVGMQL